MIYLEGLDGHDHVVVEPGVLVGAPVNPFHKNALISKHFWLYFFHSEKIG